MPLLTATLSVVLIFRVSAAVNCCTQMKKRLYDCQVSIAACRRVVRMHGEEVSFADGIIYYRNVHLS